MKPSPRIIPLLVLWMVATSAHAQYVPMDFTSQTFNAMNISSSYLLNKTLLDNARATPRGSRPQVGAAGATAPAQSTVTTGASDAARELAESFPQSQRAAARKTFEQLLHGFAAIESSLGITHGDAAAATACLVIGAFESYHDVTLDQATYQPVIRQLQSAMSADPRFAGLPAPERRALYERMAILGMYVISTRAALAGNPGGAQDKARLRDAAAGYLRYLQLDPALLSIDKRGLALRPAGP